MFFLLVSSPTTTGTDRARYKLDRQRVNYLGICTHLADARCHADISRSYNRRISSMEDVIIIGGGPVGFINALGLAQAGVRVSVIEAEPHISNSPRAAVYFWSVLGGLGRLGILEEAEPAGVRKQDYHRAMPGLSMGGRQTLFVTLHHLYRLSYIRSFS